MSSITLLIKQPLCLDVVGCYISFFVSTFLHFFTVFFFSALPSGRMRKASVNRDSKVFIAKVVKVELQVVYLLNMTVYNLQ